VIKSNRFLLASCVILLAACSAEDQPQSVESTDTAPPAFSEFLATNYAIDMEQYPQTATRRGILDHNDRWNSYSEAFRDQRRATWEQRLVDLEQFDSGRARPCPGSFTSWTCSAALPAMNSAIRSM
jgi:hypothetical protein